MTNLRKAAQMALDALESVFEGDDKGAEYWTVTGGTYEAVECMNAMRALRARLAQPEQEPKCAVIVEVFGKDWRLEYMSLPVGKHKLYTQQYTYTAPPQREWQGLTDDDFIGLTTQQIFAMKFAEAKLKERNS